MKYTVIYKQAGKSVPAKEYLYDDGIYLAAPNLELIMEARAKGINTDCSFDTKEEAEQHAKYVSEVGGCPFPLSVVPVAGTEKRKGYVATVKAQGHVGFAPLFKAEFSDENGLPNPESIALMAIFRGEFMEEALQVYATKEEAEQRLSVLKDAIGAEVPGMVTRVIEIEDADHDIAKQVIAVVKAEIVADKAAEASARYEFVDACAD